MQCLLARTIHNALTTSLRLCFGAELSAVAAQTPRNSAALLTGIALQSDYRNHGPSSHSSTLSPVGLTGGLSISRAHRAGGPGFGVSGAVSWFPVLYASSVTLVTPAGESEPAAFRNLVLMTASVEFLSRVEPAADGWPWFAGLGVTQSLSSPRTGAKQRPMASVGVLHRVGNSADVRVSVQVTAGKVGETAIQIPAAFAFHR
jgi:hypothetical protein